MNTETKILRLPAVLERVGIGKTALYGLISRGGISSSHQACLLALVGWCVEEVEQWINERPRATINERPRATGEVRAA